MNYACLGPCFLYGQSTGAGREAKRRFSLPWEAFLPSFPSFGFGFKGGGQSLSILAKLSTTEHIPGLHTFLSERKYLSISLEGTHTDTDNEMNFCMLNTQLKNCKFRDWRDGSTFESVCMLLLQMA